MGIYFAVENRFFSYRSGVYSCNGDKIAGWHAVAAVGYGTSYFTFRNSWGASWGDNGYFKFKDSTCEMFRWLYGINAVVISHTEDDNTETKTTTASTITSTTTTTISTLPGLSIREAGSKGCLKSMGGHRLLETG